jgi:hypothetical protein
MARRGFSDFVRNFGLGYGLVNQIDQDLQLGKIADAKPVQSQGFTAEDGKQLEAIANAKDAEGKPLYQVTANEDGSYGVATTADPSMAGVIRQQGVTEFLGQRTAGEMTPAQVDSARQRAMAGVIMRTDPVGGGRMLRELTQDDREAQRFSWDKQRNERDLRRSAQAEDDETFLRNLDAEAAQWHAERLKNPDGTSRAATTDDFLAATQWRAFKMAEAGRLNEASQAFRDYAAQSHIKLQLETEARNKALGETASRLAAGDLNSVRDFYNQFVPDGAKVIDVRRGADGQITIERESLDGRKMPATVMKDTGQLVSALATFRDPMAIYNWSQNEFRNNLALKADARASAAEGRAAAEFKAGETQRQLGGAMAGLQMAVINAKTPEEQAAARANLIGAQNGLGLNKKEAPTGYRWKGNGDLEPIPGGPGDKSAAAQKTPAEVQRMNVALRALDQGLVEYETILKNFNPRDPTAQLDAPTRARVESLLADLQMQFKEAQALGALTGPDLEILGKALASPTSLRGALYGRDGLSAQLGEVRKGLDRRKQAIADEFGTKPIPPSTPAAGAAPAAAGGKDGFSGLWR